MSEKRDPWDQRPGETDKAFRGFRIYRDLGADRSLGAAYHEYKHGPETGDGTGSKRGRKPAGYFSDWSTKYDWGERVRAYDAHRDKQVIQAAASDELDDFRKRVIKLSRASLIGCVNLLNKANEAIEQLDVKDVKPQQIPAMFRASAEAARVAIEAEAAVMGIDRLIDQLDES